MKGWYNEPMRHSLAARGIKMDAPYLLNQRGVRDLDINELDRKLDHYISLIDGRHEIEGGRDAIEGFYKYLDESVDLEGSGITIDDMVDFFAAGNKIFDVTHYRIVGSRAEGYNRPDSDTDLVIHLKFTDEAAGFFKPDPWEWDGFMSGLHEDMVNNNFGVRTKRGKERWIDVHYNWTYPEGVG